MIPVMFSFMTEVYIPVLNKKDMKLPMHTLTRMFLLALVLILSGFRLNSLLPEYTNTATVQQSTARILIVLQRTAFKSELTRILSEQYSSSSVHIEVAEFSALGKIKESEWTAIVILQSWEDWQPQPEITNLISKANPKEKVIVVTTSDTGQEKLDGIDAISSASMVDTASDTAQKVISRIDRLLKK